MDSKDIRYLFSALAMGRFPEDVASEKFSEGNYEEGERIGEKYGVTDVAKDLGFYQVLTKYENHNMDAEGAFRRGQELGFDPKEMRRKAVYEAQERAAEGFYRINRVKRLMEGFNVQPEDIEAVETVFRVDRSHTLDNKLAKRFLEDDINELTEREKVYGTFEGIRENMDDLIKDQHSSSIEENHSVFDYAELESLRAANDMEWIYTDELETFLEH